VGAKTRVVFRDGTKRGDARVRKGGGRERENDHPSDGQNVLQRKKKRLFSPVEIRGDFYLFTLIEGSMEERIGYDPDRFVSFFSRERTTSLKGEMNQLKGGDSVL